MKKYILSIMYLSMCFIHGNAQENIDVNIEKFTKSGHQFIKVTINNNSDGDIIIMNMASYSHHGEMLDRFPSSYMELIANPTITVGECEYVPEYYSSVVTEMEWDSIVSQPNLRVLYAYEWDSIASRDSSGLHLRVKATYYESSDSISSNNTSRQNIPRLSSAERGSSCRNSYSNRLMIN